MICTSDKRDADCVQRTLTGDHDAFEELVLRYQKPVFNAILRMVRDQEDAREISQNVFMKAFVNLRKFDGEKRFFSWLYRIAMNDSINFLHARRPIEPLIDTHRSADASPEEAFEAAETRRQIEDAMTRLSPDYKAVLVLRHFLGCSYEEMADVLEIPEKTIKSRLFSARHLLRDELLACGFGGRRASHA